MCWSRLIRAAISRFPSLRNTWAVAKAALAENYCSASLPLSRVATILAVVSALTLSTSSAIAHDFYVNWVRGGEVDSNKRS